MESDKDSEIKIITDDDESLKILGELLANKTSRDLIKYLMDNSTYKNKIADEIKVPFPLVEHHLKKLEKLGLVKITNKELVKNGKLHKNYKINANGIFVSLNSKDEVKEKGTIKKIFREGVKFASIGIVAIISFVISYRSDTQNTWSTLDNVNEFSLELPLMIIIIGLIIERIYFQIKNKKGK